MESYTSIIISGQSNAGKSTLISKMLDQSQGLFSGKQPPNRVHIYYGCWQDLYDEWQEKHGDKIEFFEGLPPTLDVIIKRIRSSPEDHILIIFDGKIVLFSSTEQALTHNRFVQTMSSPLHLFFRSRSGNGETT